MQDDEDGKEESAQPPEREDPLAMQAMQDDEDEEDAAFGPEDFDEEVDEATLLAFNEAYLTFNEYLANKVEVDETGAPVKVPLALGLPTIIRPIPTTTDAFVNSAPVAYLP